MNKPIKQPETIPSLSNIGMKTGTDNKLITGTYNARVTRDNPTALVLMLDQSGSMKEVIAGMNISKANYLARSVNTLLQEIINLCTRNTEMRNYYEICIIGYGAANEANVIWEGVLKGKNFVKISELDNSGETETIEKEINIRGTIKKQTVHVRKWIKPIALAKTPMGSAFDLANNLLQDWIKAHPHSFPPMVFNVSDGFQTDCTDDELMKKAYSLKSLSTSDGNVILFNLNISTQSGNTVLLPENAQQASFNNKSLMMYKMSSVLPELFNGVIANQLKNSDLLTGQQFVAMGYNTNVENILKIFRIGTVTIENNVV